MSLHPNNERLWLFVAILVTGGACLVLLGIRSSNESVDSIDVAVQSTWRKTEPDPEYVGSRACRECHAEIANQYAGHPMAMSMFAPDRLPDEAVSDRIEFSPVPTRRYVVSVDKSRVSHREAGLNRQGEELFEQSFEVCLAIGSGQRGRSYLIENVGRLFVSPISWYSSAARFDLSPGYQGTGHKRFSREAHVRCLHCHSGGVKNEQQTTPVADRFYELAIGCERCHGPGLSHIAWHRQQPGQREGEVDPIVNPVHLDPVRRDAVCNQCHLQGETEILRHGKIYTDFRPGELLGETQSIYVAGSGIDETQSTVAVSHTLQMESSQCYTQSNGQLGCISCHDPHGVPSETRRVEWYRQKCLACHSEQGCSLPEAEQRKKPALGSCIACHMAPLPATDVPHTAQTDHRILRTAESKQKDLRSPELNELRIFDLQVCPLPKEDYARAQGMFFAEHAEITRSKATTQQAANILRQLPDRFRGDPGFLDRQALVASLSGRTGLAQRLWKQSVHIAPDFEPAWFSLAVLARNAGDTSQSLQFLEQLIQLNPSDAELHFQRALLLESLGRHQEAFGDAIQSVELDPSRAKYRQALARLADTTGHHEVADHAKHIARQLQNEQPDITN